jgi:NitT/TauT family transport system ATP-binding protein
MAGQPGPSAAAVQVCGVGHQFPTPEGPIPVLAGVDLKVPPGQFLAILGPSGCGKSTVLRIVVGLIRPSQGRVLIDGETVTRPYTRVGIAFQEPVLLDWKTVLENVLLQARIRRLDWKEAKARAENLLTMVGLHGFERRKPYELSIGMRQRVALCRALVHGPPLLLMDEPFAALDALTREQIGADLERLWLTSRPTVIFVTHSVSEAITLADRVVVLSRRPAQVVADLEVPFERPRDAGRLRRHPEFGRLAQLVYEALGLDQQQVNKAEANIRGGEA